MKIPLLTGGRLMAVIWRLTRRRKLANAFPIEYAAKLGEAKP